MKLVVRSGGQDTYRSELVKHSCGKALGGLTGSQILGQPQLSWNPGCKNPLATSHLRPALAIVDGLMDMRHALGDGIVEPLLRFLLNFLRRSL